jgi:hypothetical protein
MVRLVCRLSTSTFAMRGTREDHNSAQSTKSSRTRLVRYWCMWCHRPRSSTYHSRHPPAEPPPPQGVCRRCRKEEHPAAPPITLYEVHHYHHHCGCRDEQPSLSTPVDPPPYPADSGYAELPAEENGRRSRSMHQLAENAPPPIKFWMKPSYQSG